MGEIHDARDAEDQRQPGGDKKQRRGAGEPGKKLDDEELHAGPDDCAETLAAALFSRQFCGRSVFTSASDGMKSEPLW